MGAIVTHATIVATSVCHPNSHAAGPPAPQQPGIRRFVPALSQILPPAVARAHSLVTGGHRLGRFLIACGLFLIILPTEIGYESQLFVSRRIFGIPPHFLLTAIAILAALATDLRYYSWLFTRSSVLLGLAGLAYVLVIGVLRHGTGSYMVRSDLYIIRWFFVGFILMRMGISSGLLRWYLAFVAVVVLGMMFTLDFESTLGHQVDTSTKRVVSWSLFPINNCGTIMISLGMMCFWPRSRRWATFFAVCFGILFFAGAIRTSTRSLFVQQGFCLGLVLFALTRDPRMKGRGQQLRRVGVVFGLLGAATLLWQILAGKVLSGYTQLGDRFNMGGGFLNDSTIWARISEADALLRSLTADEWVLGTGLGGVFFTTLGYWTNTPHVAVLGWLQKGGVFLFAAVLYFVYWKPFIGLMMAMLGGRPRSSVPPPILVVGPSLMTWALLTFFSGGLDNGSLLGLGGLVALWMQLALDEKVTGTAFSGPQPPRALQSGHSETLAARAAGV
jgi:hypothetical protein